MAPSSSLLTFFALILSAHSRPQTLHVDERDPGDAFTLPVAVGARVSPRSLPVIEEDMSIGTLPVPPADRRVPRVAAKTVQGGHITNPDVLQSEDIFQRDFPADGSLAGTLTLPVVRADSPRRSKRTVEVQLQNRSDVAYYAQLSIGTPPQKVFAQLDTGSFELWVNPNCSGLAAADRRFCNAIGRYDPANSSTSVVSDLGTSLRYGIGAANITYVLDDITLGDDATSPSATMRRVQFGVATTSEDQFAGILGIGFGRGINIGYNNFVDELARQNVTRTKAFSVALGSKDESQGVIVFGGVDSSKFSGRLARLPIIPADKSPDGVARYWVSMKGLTHVAANGTSTGLIPSSSSSRGGSGGSSGNSSSKDGDNGMPVFLDTGATLTLLPPAVAGGIASAMGATEMDLNGFHIVDCALAGRNGSVDFAFEGVTVRVPYSELIREVRAQPPTCYLGVMPSETFALLGDTFLRSAYVVFDLDGNATYMAQYNNCGTTVRTIVPSSDLKSLVGECNKGALDVNGGANDGTRSGNKPNGSSKLGSGAVGVYILSAFVFGLCTL